MPRSSWCPRIAPKLKGRAANRLGGVFHRLPRPPSRLPLELPHAPDRPRSIADNLGRAFPKLEMLVLTNNRFATLKELEALASLPTLIHLSLVDNPVRCGAARHARTGHRRHDLVALLLLLASLASASSSLPLSRGRDGRTWHGGTASRLVPPGTLPRGRRTGSPVIGRYATPP